MDLKCPKMAIRNTYHKMYIRVLGADRKCLKEEHRFR